MAGKAKFLFDLPFDGAQPERQANYKPRQPAPKFSLEELEAAKAQARAEGEAAGREEAYGERERAVDEALAGISHRLQQIAENDAAIKAEARAAAVNVAAAIARKLAAQLAAREPLREIEQLVLRCMDDMRDEPRLIVRAAEPVIRLLDQRLDQLMAQSGFGGKVMLAPDDKLAATDCRVDWADGSAERNQADLEKEVDLAVSRYISGLRAGVSESEG